MPKRSKLLQALDEHRGRDYDAEKQKKLVRAAKKKKAAKGGEEDVKEKEQEELKKKIEEVEEEDEEDEESDAEEQDASADADAASAASDDDDDDDEEEEESDIPLSDLEDDEREDVVTHQRLTINNSAAISASLKRISFLTPSTLFSEHNSLVSQEPIDVPDPNDDLARELAFYKVCQAAATSARGLLKKEGIPFTRPGDYFAEMVKTDEHMDKIKKKLFDEAAAKKAAAEARKQRDLKKFGKQVQVAKLQQRAKEKRETLEKINDLKKKRKADTSGEADNANEMFDIAIDDAQPNNRKRAFGSDGTSNAKRQKKNEKYGFGGKKRFSKSGDAVSSGDMRDFSVRKMKGGPKRGGGGGGGGGAKRPGKSRRAAAKGRA